MFSNPPTNLDRSSVVVSARRVGLARHDGSGVRQKTYGTLSTLPTVVAVVMKVRNELETNVTTLHSADNFKFFF